MRLDVEIEDARVRTMLDGVADRLGSMRPGLAAMGEVVRTSIERNFRAGGRPTAWKKSKRALDEGGATLVDSARLKNSLTVRASDTEVAVGTSVIYAGVMHFGAERGEFGTVQAQIREHTRVLATGKTVQVRAHTRPLTLPWGNIPARPFMLVQEEDWPVMVAQLADFLMGSARRLG